MSVRKIIACLLPFLMLSSGCVSKTKVSIITNSGEVTINADVADTFRKRQKGLMGRDYLDENSGMLFIFNEEQKVSFWMKNMKIPLDMIFISADGTINEIKENVQPCAEDPCPMYPSEHLVKYVLEVSAGFCSSNDIRVGNKVKILD